MLEMINKCPSLSLDALERLTVTRHVYFLVFSGHPLMFHGNKTTTVTKASSNKRFNEQNNGYARAL